VASNLSLGAGPTCHCLLTGPPDHVSTLWGPGMCPYPASYARRPAEGPAVMSRFPVAFRPPAFASWSSFVRWGVGPSLRSAYRAPCQGPDPNGVVTFRTHEMRPGRVPSIPRELWCPHGRHGIADRHLPLRNGQSLNPGPTIHQPGLRLTRHHRGFTVVHPSGLPLACGPRMEREPLGFSPELHTPPLPTTHVEVGTGTGHLPELRHHQLVLQST
jgi:hypothetical protein